MAFVEQFLIVVLTIISIIITVKSSKTAIFELSRLLWWTIEKFRQIIYMIFPNRKPVEATTTLGRIWEKSKSTLMPFISRNYASEVKRKRLIGIAYLSFFILALSLTYFFFWAFLTADLEFVVARSPYLLESITSIILAYQFLTKSVSFLFIVGFIVETINSIRSLF